MPQQAVPTQREMCRLDSAVCYSAELAKRDPNSAAVITVPLCITAVGDTESRLQQWQPALTRIHPPEGEQRAHLHEWQVSSLQLDAQRSEQVFAAAAGDVEHTGCRDRARHHDRLQPERMATATR